MLICAKCKKEMKCMKNGVRCRWRGSHIYAGDLYKCLECGSETIYTNSKPYFSDNYACISDSDYFMDNYYEEHLAPTNLNLRRKKHG